MWMVITVIDRSYAAGQGITGMYNKFINVEMQY